MPTAASSLKTQQVASDESRTALWRLENAIDLFVKARADAAVAGGSCEHHARVLTAALLLEGRRENVIDDFGRSVRKFAAAAHERRRAAVPKAAAACLSIRQYVPLL